MIQIEKLYKSFATKSVLENVSFAIHPGNKIGLVGPNGTGKTTLFKIILGQEEQDRGNVTRVHETIGYLPQTISFEKYDTLFSYLKKKS